MNRKLTISLLAVSLASNVFLGGALAGRLLAPSPDPVIAPDPLVADRATGAGARGSGDLFLARSALMDISSTGRAAVRDVFVQQRREMLSERRDLRRKKLALMSVIAADPFDAAAVKTAFAAVQEADAAHKRRQYALMATALAALSADDRKLIVDAQRARVERRRAGAASGKAPGDPTENGASEPDRQE